MIFSAYLQTANTLAWLAPRVIVTKLVSDYLTGLLPWPGVCPLSQLCLACLTGNLWGICPVLLQKRFHTSLLFCFSPMHVVAPFSFSVFWFFTPITTLQVWVMEACQAKKRPGSSVFVKQFGWSGLLLWHSGAGSTKPAGTGERPHSERSVCTCLSFMGASPWELQGGSSELGERLSQSINQGPEQEVHQKNHVDFIDPSV